MSADVNNIKKLLLEIAIIASVFSQIETIDAIARPVMYLVWILIIGFSCVNSKGVVFLSGFTKYFLGVFVTFFLLCLFNSFFSESYIQSNYLRVLAVPLLVTISGDFYADSKDEDIQKYIKTYVVCAFIYALWVQFTYFPSYNSWLTQQVYAFELKNSAAQIWSAAILLLCFLVDYKGKPQKILGFILAFYLLLITGISQCRTALLALMVVAGCYVIIKSKKKILAIAVMILAIILALNIPAIKQFIDQALFLTKYQGADLNTFSSGRLDGWERALEYFNMSPVIGVGHYYVDCSYILVLAESGIVGFLLIEGVWLTKAVRNFRYCANEKRATFLFCITIFYIVESILEGYPPFGPGVSSFMFWLLSAIILGQQDLVEEQKIE